MTTNDDDRDALAAEYVLGTLAADERAHAEALLASDAGFAETVRQWERRLGELNVMVEAVEPPAELWDKIKANIETVSPGDQVSLAPSEPGADGDMDPAAKTPAEEKPEAKALAALASTLMAPDDTQSAEPARDEAKAKIGPDWTLRPPQPSSAAAAAAVRPERSADIVYLARRVRRWRVVAAATGAVAAALAALIVVSQVAPGAFPAGGFIHMPQFVAQSPTPKPAPAAANPNRLVAVLQQDPTAPAFLLTIDPATLNLTVRRVAAASDAGHSYELWLISPGSPKPRSLGVVGANEFTERPLAKDYDLETVRNATYKISFEPAGGSKTGAPTGPILFGGKLVEAVPAPAPPAQPKT